MVYNFSKKALEGTGLGLSIAYGIINDYNGDIKITSEVNKATKVTVTLPL